LKLMLATVLRIGILSLCTHASAEDTNGNKENELSMKTAALAESSEFYIDVDSKFKKYINQWEKGEITEGELIKLVEENITPKLDTEEEVEALKLSEEIAEKEKMTASRIGEYKLAKAPINHIEKELFAKYPQNIANTVKATEIANTYSEMFWAEYTRWQGNGDAFRHALWSAIMTKDISRGWAHEFAYAHEGLRTNESRDNLDTNMDITNNYRGRVDGTTYSDLGNYELMQKVRKSVEDGKKVRIRTYTSKTPYAKVAGVPTKLLDYFSETTSGGRINKDKD
ncbi:hypothetical protein CHH69_12770, partial [Terribacillus saccharophilus]|uniref:DUF6973 domain-containing protein n=1 Tax=Terribacillus saccharophilus TaxID=361277 RepID=UPI000BCAD364